MPGLADFSADDIISSDDVTPNDVSLSGAPADDNGPNSASQAQAQEAVGDQGNLISDSLDSAAIENLLAGRVGPQEPKEEEPEQEVVKEEPKKNKLNPAQERIMQVISERNRAREETAQLAAQNAQIMQQMQQQQAMFQKEQLAIEQRRQEQYEAQRREKEEANLSEVEKARRAFLYDAKEQAKKDLMPELAELKAWKEQAELEKKQQVQAYEQHQKLAYFKNQADTMLSNVLLKDFTPDEQKEIGPGLEEMLYSFSGGFGVDPVRATPVFKQLLDKYVKAENGRLSRSAGTKVAASRQVARPVPSTRASGGAPRYESAGTITIADLQRGTPDGRTFDNFVQYNAARRPALKPRA